MFKEQYYRKLNEFIKEAKKYFVMIQQDKLLRLQYEWNEGKIEIEGVKSNYDFYPLYDDIFNVKNISPVEKEEVDVLAQHGKTSTTEDWREDYHPIAHVSYRINITEEDEKDEDNQLPPYHLFNINATGAKPLLKEALVKAKKEQHYIAIYHKEQERIRGPYVPATPSDPRPRLSNYDDKFTRDFIRKYEDQKLLNYYDAMMRERSNEEMEDDINLAVWHLEDTYERHPVEQNDDWREAIIAAANKSKKQKTADALYIVFEEYLKCRKDNIPFMPQEVEKKEAFEIFKDQVLKGRALSGEPADFNF